MRISDWSSDVCSSDLRHAGAEAAARVLEHHLHLLAPRSQVFLRQMIEGLSLEADAAFGFDQSQDRLAESGLAGTGFADDAQGLAALDRQADAVHSVQVFLAPEQTAAQGNADAQILHLQDVFEFITKTGRTTVGKECA